MDRKTEGRLKVRRYEYIYILEPQEEIARQSIENIKEHYKEMGLTLLKEEEMGKRRLAFEVNKRTDGFYYITQIEIDDFNKLRDFEHDLKLNTNIIRFMKVRI